MPGAGHIVHMPAHIYLRTGEYDRAIRLNEQAVLADEAYLSNSSDNGGLYRLMYYPHNIDFIGFASYMRGRSDLALRTAMKLAYKGGMVTAANPGFGQYLMAEPMIAYTRFGKWNDLLSLPQPDHDLIYAQVIWRYARGIAFLRSDKISDAQKELIRLDSLASLETLKSFYFSFNPASDIVQVPLHLLRGELLIRQGKVTEGIQMLTEAVVKEDGLRYNEPPDWKLFSRHFLGAALSDAGRYAEAEGIFLEDLKRNPENGWSLKGLENCQRKTNKNPGAVTRRFDKAWEDADIEISSARF
jgi:tetratricopeptide (TPR) repeat protein